MNAILQKLANLGRRVMQPHFLAFIANFGLGKGIAFVGPIVLGMVLQPALYGTLEFALASAMFIAMIASAGVPQAIMQLVLMRQGRPVADVLAITSALIAGLSLLAYVSLLALWPSQRWMMTSVLVALCAAQQCGVAYARAFGHRNINVWIDHAPTVVVVLIALLAASLGQRDNAMLLASIFAAAGLIVLTTATTLFLRRRAPELNERLREAMRIGLPLLRASLAATWTVVSVRGLSRPAAGR